MEDVENTLLTSHASRGQYSSAVLESLESQNDSQVEGILGKVRVLKDVRPLCLPPPPPPPAAFLRLRD